MFVGAWLESGGAFEKLSEADWRNNVTTGMILESILGPISGTVSADVEGGWRYHMSIGRLLR